MVMVATVRPTPQIHRLWSTALALDKGLVSGHNETSLRQEAFRDFFWTSS